MSEYIIRGGINVKTVTDALGRTISYSFPPKRIVSFAPAITETLFYLQLEQEIVGRTRFCIHPQDKVEKALNVGGTKDMKLDRVHELNPDLIIVEKEENTKEMVEQLEVHYPVYSFEVQTVDDALRLVTDLGYITAREQKAQLLREQIVAALQTLPQLFSGKKATYVI